MSCSAEQVAEVGSLQPARSLLHQGNGSLLLIHGALSCEQSSLEETEHGMVWVGRDLTHLTLS